MLLFVRSDDEDHDLLHVSNPSAPPATPTFTCATNQVAHLAEVLSAVANICSQALLIIRPTGITVYGEYNHIVNVQLTLDPSLFRVYNFYCPQTESQLVSDVEFIPDDAELRVCVNIGAISEAFNSVLGSPPPNPSSRKGPDGAGGNSSSNPKSLVESNSNPGVMCYISYNGEGHPLVVEFEDSLITEKIEFLTFFSDMYYPYVDSDSVGDSHGSELPYRLVIDHSEVQYEVIVKSDVLYNILHDLHKINTEEVFMYVSNERRKLGYRDPTTMLQSNLLLQLSSNVSFVDNQLNFISKGPIGFLKLLYPSERTVLEKLLIYEHHDVVDGAGLQSTTELRKVNSSLITSYKFDNFIKILPAVRLSTKCKIMKDFNGILSVQLLCKNVRLPNYSGSLITFNMLELATMNNDIDAQVSPNFSYITLNNIFDDDLYEYVKDYRADGRDQEIIEYATDQRSRLGNDQSSNRGAIELPLFI